MLIPDRTRELTLRLLSWPSVTGSQGERDFGPRLHAELAAWPYFETNPSYLWLEDAGAGRSVVCALVRGKGEAGAILAGHYDTVDDSEFGPDLLDQLRRRGEWRAVADLESGDWLGGRGALDMKSGLAAGLVALERHAAIPDPVGSVLFVACPDEEGLSAGARAAAPVLRRLAGQHGLQWQLGVNMDIVTDDGDGAYGAQVFHGCVGKVLLCTLVRGRPAHSGEPLAGISAHALAAEVVRTIEGRSFGEPELAPPVLLHGGDTKTAYDVTMPAEVLLMFNLIVAELSPAGALAIFEERVRDALRTGLDRWGSQEDARVAVDDVPEASGDPVGVTRAALSRNALDGPGAVVALGPVRYPPVAGGPGPRYPHVNDMSLLSDGVVPWVNAGPWGRDFHQLAERVYTPYAFGELPDRLTRMLGDLR